MDYKIKIGGEAGQGIQTIGDTLSKVFSRGGYNVFTHQDYESRVRGGHNYFSVRYSDSSVMAVRNMTDILVALDKESIARYEAELTEHAIAIYDSTSIGEKHEGRKFLDIPFESIALKHGGSKIMSNVVATGAVLGLLGMDLDILLKIIRDTFKKKGEAVINANISSAMAGHDYAVENCAKCSFAGGSIGQPKLLIAGNDAIGLGAVASGCKFYSAYPMTPSTGIMIYIASKAMEYGIIVEQAEDEISAINMALGASFAGVRAMTSSAGGGFALMVEGLSLAAITETPIVIGLAQRPAPATGLPTRTEQADLLFALYSSHGEFPRVIFTPGTPKQCFYLTNKAFDIAEKYQIPVFVITDQYLADSQWTYDKLDTSKLKYVDYRLRGDALDAVKDYKRHAYTETGVSPLAIPGQSRHLVVTDSDEHDEEGHLIEDAETRVKMMQKRLFKKLPLITEEIDPPVFYGDGAAETILCGWGSTYGVMKETVDELRKRGLKAGMIHFSEVYPLPSRAKFDYIKAFESSKLAVCIENNATGQFAKLLKTETGYEFKHRINKYDGRPFSVEGLLGEVYKCQL